MSRLLFAAARGARVQRQQLAVHSDRTWWEDCALQWGMDDELRVHPDDEHLQYGPVSTALIEFAETGKEPYTLMGLMALEAFYYEWVYPDAGENSDEYARMFALILAEALADEGL